MKTHKSWTGYKSTLASHIENYLSVKRALGCKFISEARSLRLLDTWLAEQGAFDINLITDSMLQEFFNSRKRKNNRSYNHLLGVVRRLFEWLVNQQIIELSPLKLKPLSETRKELPYIFEPSMVRSIINETAKLTDSCQYQRRATTYQMIFTLLAVLGLRVSEVVRIKRNDVDLINDILLIRDSKFGKSRYVPLGIKVSSILEEYLESSRDCHPSILDNSRLFTWDGERSISTNTIRNIFREKLLKNLMIDVPDGTRQPCVHSLRHSFAVRTLLTWYRKGIDPMNKINHLSTFMGHVNPTSTAYYLTITSDLLEEANHRFESYTKLTREFTI